MKISLFMLFMGFMLLLPIQPTFAAVPTVGTVKYLRGKVVAVRGSEEVVLKKGDSIFEGDLLKTGRRSSIFAAMKGDENNSIRMGQKSQMRVEKYKLSDGQVIGGFLRGLIGIFTVELNRLRKGSSFMMKTPTAVLGVRGTIWGTVVNADGSTTFAVKRGSVKVKMSGKSVLLKQGQSVSVTKSGKVSAVQATSPALKDALESNGEEFDNTESEAKALTEAKAEAELAKEALAEAAALYEKKIKEAKKAKDDADDADDEEAKKVAEALLKEAELIMEDVIAAADAFTLAKSKEKAAADAFEKASAGVVIVDASSQPDGDSDPTSGLEPGSSGGDDQATSHETSGEGATSTTGGGGTGSPS